MVEAERIPNPLIDKVTQQRSELETQRQSETLALQMLPDFKSLLNGLISAKIPAPEVTTQRVTRFNTFDYDEMEDFGHSRRRHLKTKLTASIPVEDGDVIKVTVSASTYPDLENPEPAKDLEYQVDIEDLDRILIIEGSKATLQSKRWESDPFTKDTVIGAPLPSWPSWERPAKAEDIIDYQALLEGLNQEGVTFEGSTPPIINRDYSEMRKQLKLPNI